MKNSSSKKLNICVIGAGFAGISAATNLANYGHNVFVVEKNSDFGGRARKLKAKGFTFDMGPSWYWMPDVFERHFEINGEKIEDYLKLKRLNPSYKIFFSDKHIVSLPVDFNDIKKIFEKYEKGSGENLTRFLKDAEKKYKIGMNKFVRKPSKSVFEFFNSEIIAGLFKMDLFKSMHTHIRKFFNNKFLIKIIEFPLLFLGATPKNTPALYSLMNYADIKLGTWYPDGGMHKIIEAMISLAKKKGVVFYSKNEVKSFQINNKKIVKVETNKKLFDVDIVLSGADYHHTEQKLLPPKYRNYSSKYWDKKTMSPSSLLFYLGTNKKLKNIEHHCLFFDKDFDQHANDIYEFPQWPEEPLFYGSFSSKSDNSVSPKGCENIVLLVPIAPNLKDSDTIREKYYNIIMDRLEKLTKQSIKKHVIYKKSYCINNFKKDYNSFRGNAYGLANTLFQTAIFKPSIKNKKLNNLYYCGQLTVPGPGVPPSIISGEVSSKEIIRDFN